jgi:hypothetical protein
MRIHREVVLRHDVRRRYHAIADTQESAQRDCHYFSINNVHVSPGCLFLRLITTNATNARKTPIKRTTMPTIRNKKDAPMVPPFTIDSEEIASVELDDDDVDDDMVGWSTDSTVET